MRGPERIAAVQHGREQSAARAIDQVYRARAPFEKLEQGGENQKHLVLGQPAVERARVHFKSHAESAKPRVKLKEHKRLADTAVHT